MQKSLNSTSLSISFHDGGQALVEYILMLAVMIALLGIIGKGFKNTIIKLWNDFTQQISAACPGCPPDPKYQIH